MNLKPALIMPKLMFPSLDPYEVGIGENAAFLISMQLVEPGKVDDKALSASSMESYELA